MYGILPGWLKSWLFGSTIVCSLDVAFTTLRPETLPGGRLDRYFFLWHLYADVDLRYADPTDPMTQVTGLLMGVELALNLMALFGDLFRPTHFHALMAAFTSSTLVFWKTTIYLGLYLVPMFYGGQNLLALDTPAWKAALLFWLPNSVWVFVPLVAMFYLWRAIGRGWAHRRLAAEKNDEDEESEHFEGIPLSNGQRRLGSSKCYQQNGKQSKPKELGCCAGDEALLENGRLADDEEMEKGEEEKFVQKMIDE